jgi:tRNA-splicing ligase RtcB (3'-phosphate/5'-hydroxy nucleic acid ligase)
MQIIDNIPVWGAPVDEGALRQIKTCYYIFGQAAMMADHHKGYGVPIGGVIAHETLVSPSGVGYDIGCGNKAVITDADAVDVRANIARLMDDIWNTISFGLARKNKEPVDHELFDDNNDDAWQITQGANSAAWKLTSLRDMARAQLGTIGSGNHYVDIFEDEQGRIWIGVHFGSRGFGHKIATRFLNRAGAKDDMDSAPVALDSRTHEGHVSSTRSITITTSHGERRTMAEICGSYRKERRRRSPANAVSLAERWEKRRSSWKAWRTSRPRNRSTRPSTEPAA